MPTLKQGQASNCANPQLVYAQQSFEFPNNTDTIEGAGTMFDVDALDFQIYDSSGAVIAPTPGDANDWTAVDVLNDCPAGHRLGVGRYVAAYTVDANADPGAYRVRWRITERTGDPFTYSDTWYQVIPSTDPLVNSYAQIHDLRCEGVPGTFSLERMASALERAARFVDDITRRRFVAEYKTINVDGAGSPILLLREPIVMIEDVVFNTTTFVRQEVRVSSADLRVYNRHIRENMLNPDDRDAPRVELLHSRKYGTASDGYVDGYPRGYVPSGGGYGFQDQQQNMQVIGVFGYTEYDGSSMGRTPLAIREVTLRLAMRNLRPLWRTASKGGGGPAGPITMEKTRDQTVQYANTSGSGAATEAAFTGDWEIDSILSMYMAPPNFTAA